MNHQLYYYVPGEVAIYVGPVHPESGIAVGQEVTIAGPGYIHPFLGVVVFPINFIGERPIKNGWSARAQFLRKLYKLGNWESCGLTATTKTLSDHTKIWCDHPPYPNCRCIPIKFDNEVRK